MNSKVYKWCAVPQCRNTSIKTPKKVFVHVPNNKTMRNKWFCLARRDPTAVKVNSTIYFCEDHFDLPNDMENFMQYHVMGFVSQVRMKPGCLPTKFQCQPDRRKRTSKITKRPNILRKQRQTLIEEAIKDLEEKSISVKHLEMVETSSGSTAEAEDVERSKRRPLKRRKIYRPIQSKKTRNEERKNNNPQISDDETKSSSEGTTSDRDFQAQIQAKQVYYEHRYHKESNKNDSQSITEELKQNINVSTTKTAHQLPVSTFADQLPICSPQDNANVSTNYRQTNMTEHDQCNKQDDAGTNEDSITVKMEVLDELTVEPIEEPMVYFENETNDEPKTELDPLQNSAIEECSTLVNQTTTDIENIRKVSKYDEGISKKLDNIIKNQETIIKLLHSVLNKN